MEDQKDIERAFGKVIREIRLSKNLSQEKLSQLAKMDRAYVSEIERGIKTVSIRSIIKLAIGLDKNPSDILSHFEERNAITDMADTIKK